MLGGARWIPSRHCWLSRSCTQSPVSDSPDHEHIVHSADYAAMAEQAALRFVCAAEPPSASLWRATAGGCSLE